MTQAEKNTWQALTNELVATESSLSSWQAGLNAAIRARDNARKTLADFMDSIEPSDAPPVKRKYERKSKGDALTGGAMPGNPGLPLSGIPGDPL